MTPRQERILKTIVEYYVQTATPVGSHLLADQFEVSPATIRSEMVHLERSGYITHPHTSAGRIPTDTGYRFYVESILKPRQKLDATTRVRRAIAHRIDSAGSPQEAIKVAVDSLVYVTRNVVFATMGAAIYTKGFSQIFQQPEFSDDISEVAGLLDNLEDWLQEMQPGREVRAYIGEENAVGKSSGCSVIVAGYESSYSPKNYVGIIGPTRQNYGTFMGIVDHTARTLEEVLI